MAGVADAAMQALGLGIPNLEFPTSIIEPSALSRPLTSKRRGYSAAMSNQAASDPV